VARVGEQLAQLNGDLETSNSFISRPGYIEIVG